VLGFSSSSVWVLVTAGIAGALGGLASSLLLFDPSQHPEHYTASERRRIVLIRVAVGTVAAGAFLYFFPMQQKSVVGPRGHLATTTTYPFLSVVALGLIVGSGGSAFLSAMRDRVTAIVGTAKAEQRTEGVKEVAKARLQAAPAIASEIAMQHVAEAVSAAKDGTGRHLQVLAEGLPPSTRLLGHEAYAAMTGILRGPTDTEPTVADPAEASSAVANALDPLSSTIATRVKDALDAFVSESTEQIDGM
jgi:hypothetical protein